MRQWVETYYDLDHAEYLTSRNRELPRHISRLIQDFSLPKDKIREVVQIGPGLGNETIILRNTFPRAQLIAIDHDPIALAKARQTADQTIEFDAMSWLADISKPQSDSSRLVVALRTSPAIVSGLLQIPSSGDIRIASLVGPKPAEDQLVASLRRQGIPIVAIDERRGFYDFAFRLP